MTRTRSKAPGGSSCGGRSGQKLGGGRNVPAPSPPPAPQVLERTLGREPLGENSMTGHGTALVASSLCRRRHSRTSRPHEPRHACRRTRGETASATRENGLRILAAHRARNGSSAGFAQKRAASRSSRKSAVVLLGWLPVLAARAPPAQRRPDPVEALRRSRGRSLRVLLGEDDTHDETVEGKRLSENENEDHADEELRLLGSGAAGDKRGRCHGQHAHTDAQSAKDSTRSEARPKDNTTTSNAAGARDARCRCETKAVA